MRASELWQLSDFFQRFTEGYPANERWVREADAREAVAAARQEGVIAGSQVVRHELLAWLNAQPASDTYPGGDAETWINADEIETAIDRIVPDIEP